MVTRFIRILLWETLENLPLVIGSVLAVQLLPTSWIWAVTVVMLAMLSGATLIHLTERFKGGYQPTLRETVINFVVFVVLAIPLVFYFSWFWSSFLTDIGLGVVVGILVSMGEMTGWTRETVVDTGKSHTIAMAVAAAALIAGVRLLLMIDTIVWTLLVGVLIALVVSAAIVRIDYWRAVVTP